MFKRARLGAVVSLLVCSWISTVYAVDSSLSGCPQPDRLVWRIPTRHEGRAQQVRMQIRRLKNPGRPPVILAHAVVLTNLAMNSLGCTLWERGFDVWMPNMRGHGNGEERTTVTPYLPGGYSFDRIVAEDWPYVLRRVYEQTGSKVHILGYSMGGMTWEQTLSGVYKNPHGQMDRSSKLVEERSAMVASFVPLVVPPDLTRLSSPLKKILGPFRSVFASNHFFIPLTTNTSPGSYRLWHLGEGVRRVLIRAIAPIFHLIVPGGILGGSNYRSAEFRKLSTSEISSPHTDYVSDLITWFSKPYSSRDGRVLYHDNKTVQVPMLAMIASEDRLAPAYYTIARLQRFYGATGRLSIAVLDGFAHIDVVFDRAIERYREVLVRFLSDPAGYLRSQPQLITI